MSDSEKDRRDHGRRLTCVVAEVDDHDKSSLALIRNVSRSGALLFVTRPLDLETQVDLLIHTTSDPEGRKINASATVKRSEELDPSRADFWRYQLGVHFDEPLDADQDVLDAITKQLVGK